MDIFINERDLYVGKRFENGEVVIETSSRSPFVITDIGDGSEYSERVYMKQHAEDRPETLQLRDSGKMWQSREEKFRLYGAFGCFHSSARSIQELKDLCLKERGCWTIKNEKGEVVGTRDDTTFWNMNY